MIRSFFLSKNVCQEYLIALGYQCTYHDRYGNYKGQP